MQFMCGRFAMTLPADAMASLFEATLANDLPDWPNYNICPTNQIGVVISQEDTRRFVSMRWGFIPHWYKKPGDGPLLINARSETIAEKPAFRKAARERRCLIPATGFYEWTKDSEGNRLPWYIYPSEGPLVFAGVWRSWGQDEVMNTCAIVTTNAGARMQEIHHREPVVLRPKDWGMWLGEEGKGAALLMTATEPGALKFHRVDRAVNSNRASGPELIEPLDE